MIGKLFFCFIVNKICRVSADFCVFVLQSGFLAVKTETNITTVMKISSSSLTASDQIRSAFSSLGLRYLTHPPPPAGQDPRLRHMILYSDVSLHGRFWCCCFSGPVWSRWPIISTSVLSFQGEKLSDAHAWDTDEELINSHFLLVTG